MNEKFPIGLVVVFGVALLLSACGGSGGGSAIVRPDSVMPMGPEEEEEDGQNMAGGIETEALIRALEIKSRDRMLMRADFATTETSADECPPDATCTSGIETEEWTRALEAESRDRMLMQADFATTETTETTEWIAIVPDPNVPRKYGAWTEPYVRTVERPESEVPGYLKFGVWGQRTFYPATEGERPWLGDTERYIGDGGGYAQGERMALEAVPRDMTGSATYVGRAHAIYDGHRFLESEAIWRGQIVDLTVVGRVDFNRYVDVPASWDERTQRWRRLPAADWAGQTDQYGRPMAEDWGTQTSAPYGPFRSSMYLDVYLREESAFVWGNPEREEFEIPNRMRFWFAGYTPSDSWAGTKHPTLPNGTRIPDDDILSFAVDYLDADGKTIDTSYFADTRIGGGDAFLSFFGERGELPPEWIGGSFSASAANRRDDSHHRDRVVISGGYGGKEVEDLRRPQ